MHVNSRESPSKSEFSNNDTISIVQNKKNDKVVKKVQDELV